MAGGNGPRSLTTVVQPAAAHRLRAHAYGIHPAAVSSADYAFRSLALQAVLLGDVRLPSVLLSGLVARANKGAARSEANVRIPPEQMSDCLSVVVVAGRSQMADLSELSAAVLGNILDGTSQR